MKFRLLVGTHVCDDSYTKACPDCREVVKSEVKKCPKCGFVPTNRTATADSKHWKGVEKVYRAGTPDNIIDTTQDLVRLNPGDPSQVRKFERVDNIVSHAEPTVVERKVVVDLQEMALPELQAYAEEEEIPLGAAKTADDARKVIRAARKQLQAV